MFNILISKTLADGLTQAINATSTAAVVSSITSSLILLGAPIVGIMVIYGGFLILTAQDDPEKVKSGMNTIKYAVIGFIIVLLAYGIVAVVKEVMGYNDSTSQNCSTGYIYDIGEGKCVVEEE